MASQAAISLFSVVNKNVLVTGGSRGVGFMIAKGFKEAGANVIITSRDEKACAEAAAKLQCQYIASNVSTREGCEALAHNVTGMFQNRLDVLINNAGTSWGEPLDREKSKTNWGFDKVFDLVRIFSVVVAGKVYYFTVFLCDLTLFLVNRVKTSRMSRVCFI